MSGIATAAGRGPKGGCHWLVSHRATGWPLVAGHAGRRLFFSMGVDCVGAGRAPSSSRAKPGSSGFQRNTDPLFGSIPRQRSGAHSLSGIQGGAGRTFSFYCANLARKFGDRWQEHWQRAPTSACAHGISTPGQLGAGRGHPRQPSALCRLLRAHTGFPSLRHRSDTGPKCTTSSRRVSRRRASLRSPR
jgi:hypothetical protein